MIDEDRRRRNAEISAGLKDLERRHRETRVLLGMPPTIIRCGGCESTLDAHGPGCPVRKVDS